MTSRLEQLARLEGIALEYQDVWGRVHHAPPGVLAALLGAMHVPVGDAAAIEAAIAAHDAAGWQRALPPACVLDEGQPATVPLRLPGAHDASTLHWSITEEGGAQRQAGFRPQELAVIDRSDTARVARALPLPADLPLGYHRLRIAEADRELSHCLLIVAPGTCYVPLALEGDGRLWGASVQLYAVRSERNWGIGDFTDLLTLVELWGGRGAGVIGVSPLHALFPHNPAHASPYSPSSRLFLNTLYLDVEAIADYGESDAARSLVRSAAFQARLNRLRAAELVDYPGVAQAKRQVLEMLYGHFRATHLAHESARAQAFRAFCAAGGERLRLHALFEALQEQFHRGDPAVWGWPAWPVPYRDPASAEVARFSQEHGEGVAFYQYLQWQANLQLTAVGRRSYELSLGVGLYQDLAVSIDRGGAEAWAGQALYAIDASIGAPPDPFNLKGQNWGLPPPIPGRLADGAYASFVATLRANMQHCGALRIDHVMALARLYWIGGGSAEQGAYVHYPFDDLLAIVRLESRRNCCLVIGEDLGTVPADLRQKLAAGGVLSCRLLYFERDGDGGFLAPQDYPAQALVAPTTHDLPTLAGWWEGCDLELRTRLGLFPDEQQRQRRVIERSQDRARLLLALEREKLLPEGSTVSPLSLPRMTAALAGALHRYLARSPAKIVLAQLEDVLGVRDQVNLPGTTDAHPNWRRTLPLALEGWPADERFIALARMFEQERGRGRLAEAKRPGRARAVIPRATYRVQLHGEFTFADATALVPYLAELGVSHMYCSPFLRARAGSRHGYDIVDHNALNPEIGNRDDFERLVGALRRHGMGLLIDVVPNHMGVLGGDNGWWLDVLENGAASRYASFFDIDWAAVDPALTGKVLLPILGDQYGIVLERGELKLAFEPADGSFALRYHEHRLPIDPATYPRVLAQAEHLLAPGVLPQHAADALASLRAALGHLPGRRSADEAQRAERQRDKEVHKAQLARLTREFAPLAEAIERAVIAISGDPADSASFAPLDALIDLQAYRLAYWRVAADEINYRRFFDINELAALRMERAEVFDATHRLVLDLAAGGKVDGLRIDHPDGLLDPAAYFSRLQRRYAELVSQPGATSSGDEAAERPLYVVAEKIVAPHEQLPRDWPVHGTTGYRFANVVNGLFVDPAAKTRLDRAWRAFVGDEAADFEELAYRCRRLVMATSLSGELTVLANALLRLARADRRTRDFTLNSLRQALAEVVACFPVYRTYVTAKTSSQDRRFIDWAIGRAHRRGRAADATVFEFIRCVLLGKPPPGADPELRAGYLAFTQRLQQYTAPVTAKGVEDTAFYRHHRLVALNEVGGDPDVFGFTVSAFHGASRDRALRWPHTMLASSTHDTKRSEDVRLRLDVLSELPAMWRLAVRRWSRINRSKRRTVDGRPAPSRNDEYLLYQILVGTFPAGRPDEKQLAAYRSRIAEYMLKAAREAKRHTSWINPDPAYEEALTGFVEALLGRCEGNLFLDDLRAALPPFVHWGAYNALSMALLKFASPGVPDIYQGEELIELALVDPDNRRPVDFGLRRRLLGEFPAGSDGVAALRALLAAPHDGRAKLWVIHRLLLLRRERPDLFAHDEYLPLAVEGARARHVVAFARRHRGAVLVAVAARLYASLGLEPGAAPAGELWRDTCIDFAATGALGPWRDVLTGGVLTVEAGAVSLAAVFAAAPIALLVFEGPADTGPQEVKEKIRD